MKNRPHRLILFTRYPVPGSTKTRLIPALGEQGAADLQREMTEHTLENIRPLLNKGVRIEVRYEGGGPGVMARWLGEDLAFAPQGEGDLGERMERAFQEAFAQGERKVVLVGSDCPDLTTEDLRDAFNILDSNPVVLGPARDGGYYLIGMRTESPDGLFPILFSNIPWGTGEVLSRTVNSLADAGLDTGLLDEKNDVDEPSDLVYWEKIQKVKCRVQSAEYRAQTRSRSDIPILSTATISVIVPTLNEEERIGETLRQIGDEDLEIIVADGGSIDKTVEVCRKAGVKVIDSQPGRAVQMNAGAAEASGQILLFLHADTRLPAGFPGMVRGVISSGAAGGAFSFGTDWDIFPMRVVAWGANLRARFFGIVFGDQGIFARADWFRKVGGFPDIPLLEDFELVRALKKNGRFQILQGKAVSSARRWKNRGIWRTTLTNQAITLLYLVGVNPEKLDRWYRGET